MRMAGRIPDKEKRFPSPEMKPPAELSRAKPELV
jgi:hypothetical protein